jgi:hypothetical protein
MVLEFSLKGKSILEDFMVMESKGCTICARPCFIKKSVKMANSLNLIFILIGFCLRVKGI